MVSSAISGAASITVSFYLLSPPSNAIESMSDNKSAYREARELIWPVCIDLYCLPGMFNTEPIHAVVEELLNDLGDTIQSLLSLKSSAKSKPLETAISDWAGHLQTSRDLYRKLQEAGVLLPRSDGKGDFVRGLGALVMDLMGLSAMGRDLKKYTGVKETPSYTEQLKAFNQQLNQLERQGAKLEKRWAALGKKVMGDYLSEKFVWVRGEFCDEDGEKVFFSRMGAEREPLTNFLFDLDGDDPLPWLELYHETNRSIRVEGNTEEGVSIFRADPASPAVRSQNSSIPMERAADMIAAFASDDSGWFAGVDWVER